MLGWGGQGVAAGAGCPNCSAVTNYTRLGKGPIDVRSIATGFVGNSRALLELQRIIIGGGGAGGVGMSHGMRVTLLIWRRAH